jgi:glycosyltransferase involved in cell wall biosynthesis
MPDKITEAPIKDIVVFTHSLFGGGAEKVAVTLADRFSERDGLRAHLVLMRPVFDYTPGLLVRTTVLSKSNHKLIKLIAYPFIAIKFGLLLRKLKPAATLSLMPAPNLIAWLGWIVAGKPGRLSVSEHASIRLYSGLRKYAFKAIRTLIYKKVDTLVCVSAGIAGELKNEVPALKSVAVVGNPFDLALIRKKSKEQADCFDIIACGRLDRQKGFDVLIRAVSLMKNGERLGLVGDGPILKDLEELAQALGVKDRVTFLGFRSNPFSLMNKAKVFALSSRQEGFGNVIIEAMASGVPCVAANCPYGPGEIIKHGVNGLLVNPDNPTELATALAEVLGDERLAENLKCAGYATAAKYESAAIASQYLNVMLE